MISQGARGWIGATWVLAFALGAMALFAGRHPETAYACSGDEPLAERLARATVIVGGPVDRVALSRERQPAELPGSEPKSPPAYLRAEVSLSVTEVFWGSPREEILFVDRRSVELLLGGDLRWAGGSGTCGVLGGDPTGQYAVIAFQEVDGELVTSSGLAVFGSSADAPEVSAYRQLLCEFLARR